jgi:hypothetical protein
VDSDRRVVVAGVVVVGRRFGRGGRAVTMMVGRMGLRWWRRGWDGKMSLYPRAHLDRNGKEPVAKSTVWPYLLTSLPIDYPGEFRRLASLV